VPQSLREVLSEMTLFEALQVLRYAVVRKIRRGIGSMADALLVGMIEDNVLSRAA
jgi:hypothetical protein